MTENHHRSTTQRQQHQPQRRLRRQNLLLLGGFIACLAATAVANADTPAINYHRSATNPPLEQQLSTAHDVVSRVKTSDSSTWTIKATEIVYDHDRIIINQLSSLEFEEPSNRLEPGQQNHRYIAKNSSSPSSPTTSGSRFSASSAAAEVSIGAAQIDLSNIRLRIIDTALSGGNKNNRSKQSSNQLSSSIYKPITIDSSSTATPSSIYEIAGEHAKLNMNSRIIAFEKADISSEIVHIQSETAQLDMRSEQAEFTGDKQNLVTASFKMR